MYHQISHLNERLGRKKEQKNRSLRNEGRNRYPSKIQGGPIIMQIRRQLTLRLQIFICQHPHMFTMSKYELHSCLIAKNENYSSPLP